MMIAVRGHFIGSCYASTLQIIVDGLLQNQIRLVSWAQENASEDAFIS